MLLYSLKMFLLPEKCHTLFDIVMSYGFDQPQCSVRVPPICYVISLENINGDTPTLNDMVL